MRRLSFAAAASLCLLLTPPLAQANAGGGKTYTFSTPTPTPTPSQAPAPTSPTTVDCRATGAATNPFAACAKGTQPVAASGAASAVPKAGGGKPLAPAPQPVVSAPQAPAPTAPAALLPALTAALPLGALGSGRFQVAPTTERPTDSSGGEFRTVCDFAKMARIDPIVYPGTVNQSHLHTFFGNVDVNENSTSDTLLAFGNSTCRGGIANRSAYWVPTMIDTATGNPVVPDSINVYYKSGFVSGDKLTRGIPPGLRMVAGTASATAPLQGTDVLIYRFKCIGGLRNENDKYGSAIPNCDLGASVWQEVFFPQCWDGVNLDSPDHKSHMSYPVNVPIPGNSQGLLMQVCPASHPVILPAISFNVIYTAKAPDAALKWRLSSDNYDPAQPGGYSSHADWFNGWRHDVSEAWFQNCLVAKKDCHSHLLGDWRMIY